VRELPTLREVAARELAQSSVGRIRDTVVRAYGHGDVDVDYAAVTEMRVGASHRAHADAERRTGDGSWEPNHTPHRAFTALLYLNSNPEAFAGGELVFRRDEVTVTPKAGTLVLAPTSGRYEHEVREITHGTRWLLAVWFKRLTSEPLTS
jgi:predicted 2-oxoglutarate/Fe(II)-dependent dioxygenase YbiX